MRRLCVILFSGLILLAFAVNDLRADTISNAATGRVVKVLPLYLDLKGHAAPSPSLFDRDAYQFYLLEHTNEISAIRFDVMWKARNAAGLKLKLRLELHGIGAGGLPRQMVLEQIVTPKPYHHWTSLMLGSADYKDFGALAAWRATLWNGGELLGEQKSFLW